MSSVVKTPTVSLVPSTALGMTRDEATLHSSLYIVATYLAALFLVQCCHSANVSLSLFFLSCDVSFRPERSGMEKSILRCLDRARHDTWVSHPVLLFETTCAGCIKAHTGGLSLYSYVSYGRIIVFLFNMLIKLLNSRYYLMTFLVLTLPLASVVTTTFTPDCIEPTFIPLAEKISTLASASLSSTPFTSLKPSSLAVLAVPR